MKRPIGFFLLLMLSFASCTAFAANEMLTLHEILERGLQQVMRCDQYAEQENYAEAATCYQDAASAGNVYAQYRLGVLYRSGSGVMMNYEKALSHFRKAASRGEANAQYALGEMYEFGQGTPVSLPLAFEEYRNAAHQNHPAACYKVGHFLQNGIAGVEKNEKYAIGWYRRATKGGNPEAMVALGDMCMNDDNLKGAAIWYRKAARRHNVQSQYMLGYLSEKGLGVQKNISQAIRWYTLAAENGHDKAQESLDRINGNVDASLAKDREAAEKGDSKAMYNLGVAYNNGIGVAIDHPTAIDWFIKAAEADKDDVRLYKLRLLKMLCREEFKSLEKAAQDLRENKNRLPNQIWKLEQFYNFIAQPIDSSYWSDPHWQYLKEKIDKWVDAYPRSITARVTLAQHLVSYAWKARGRDSSSTVSEENWQKFRERLIQAEGVLKTSEKLEEKCPHWYAVMLKIALGQGWEADRYDALFNAAIGFEPTYNEYYSAKTFYLSPRWYGDNASQLAFAEEAERILGGREGQALYAKICWYACASSGNAFQFMQRNQQHWPKIRQGFLAREELYSENQSDLNRFAYMAFYAGDRSLSKKLFQRIGDDWDDSVFGTKSNFEEVRDQALNWNVQ